MTCPFLSVWYFDSEASVRTVTTDCWLCMQRSACKAAARGLAGPSSLQIPFGNTCALALALVPSRDPRPVSSYESKEQDCGISSGSETGDGKPCLQRSIMVGYPTASAAVGFRSREQSKLFSFNEYHVLPAYALIGLNSLSTALAVLHIP